MEKCKFESREGGLFIFLATKTANPTAPGVPYSPVGTVSGCFGVSVYINSKENIPKTIYTNKCK